MNQFVFFFLAAVCSAARALAVIHTLELRLVEGQCRMIVGEVASGARSSVGFGGQGFIHVKDLLDRDVLLSAMPGRFSTKIDGILISETEVKHPIERIVVLSAETHAWDRFRGETLYAGIQTAGALALYQILDNRPVGEGNYQTSALVREVGQIKAENLNVYLETYRALVIGPQKRMNFFDRPLLLVTSPKSIKTYLFDG